MAALHSDMLDIVVTQHALKRINERGCDPDELKNYLLGTKKIILRRNGQGYEILLPFKGRLAGMIEADRFIAKTFLLPIYKRRDYLTYVRKTVYNQEITLRNIIIPSKIKRREAIR